ncbi:hypothetical protein H1P_1630019 [Hyella patelloides LEGE 07179]|uniref:Uncharacterized protein n=1 Tax=Hyella patelloides LEGE 07179 TaxID=945734 RepID=A0A563VN47_9CYAN|nr:hypothetical protein H1P_1630019 [Hyella patelloides LEGE 07179]
MTSISGFLGGGMNDYSVDICGKHYLIWYNLACNFSLIREPKRCNLKHI